jgi:proline iminopeptidase
MSRYPNIEPYDQQFVTVSDQHTLYVEQCGNPDGKPVLFVHGGPGSGTNPEQRRFFNPEAFRVILVDQRGSGKSRPFALNALDGNTTQALIGDFELIRELLGIEQWLLFGGSWGSTLSLAYAQAHPDRVTGLILRGIFLATQREANWVFGQAGARSVYPDVWEKLVAEVGHDNPAEIVSSLYQRICAGDEAAARAVTAFELRISHLVSDEKLVDAVTNSPEGLAIGSIECHYFYHKFFLEENQLLINIDIIKHLPCDIVHGRYDMICPFDNAWRLHRAWPGSNLHIIPTAGHSTREPGIGNKLVEVMDTYA